MRLVSKIIGHVFGSYSNASIGDLYSGADYLRRICRSETTVTEHFEEINGFRALAVSRPSDLYTCYSDSRGLLLMDGNPARGSSTAKPKELLDKYFRIGVEGLAQFWDGPFVLVIVDRLNNRISLVCDTTGLKPCYWVEDNCSYSFSTSAGALVESGIVDGGYDLNAIARYATLNYRASFGSRIAFFDGVNRLYPGEWIVFEPDREPVLGGGVSLDATAPYLVGTLDILANEYRDKLSTSLKDLVCRVDYDDLVVALSGGIDSGSIISTLSRIGPRPPSVISMLYGQGEECELEYINYSAELNAGRRFEFWLGPDDLMEDLPDLYHRYDIPISTVSVYAYDKLFSHASELGFSTIVTGGSGDALQGGNYPYYLYNLVDCWFSSDDLFTAELESWISNHSTSKFPKSQEVFDAFLNEAVDLRVLGQLRSYDLSLYPGLLHRDLAELTDGLALPIVDSYGSWMRSYAAQEYQYEVIPPIAAAEETIDWINDCEIVSPFLSRALIEFGWKLPNQYKIANGVNKVLVRYAFADELPNQITSSIHKKGFNAPLDRWFRNEMKDFLMDYLHSTEFRQRGIYDLTALEVLLDEHMSDSADHRMVLWQILNLELWFRAWTSFPGRSLCAE